MALGTAEKVLSLAKRVEALSREPEVLRQSCHRAVSTYTGEDCVSFVVCALALSAQGHAQVRSLLFPLMSVLNGKTLLAIVRGPLEDATLLSEASKVWDRMAAEKAEAVRFQETLGHRVEKARATRNVDELERLSETIQPLQVAALLQNPRTTESLVLRMAARQPQRVEPLHEIWNSTRWAARAPIQRALAFNPYTPLDIGLRVVPLLPRHDLNEVRLRGHPVIQEWALFLLQGLSL